MRLRLLPVGPVPSHVLDTLARSVGSMVPWEVETGPSLALPESLQQEGQLDAREVAALLPEGRRDLLVMGVTESDVTVPAYSFVFGYAIPLERRAIVSLSRLQDEPTRHDAAGQVLLIQRATKEILHEAGHLLGLRHCPDPECVMHYSQTLQDTDIKSERFCARCARELSRLPEAAHEG